jgi:hypothetical protein
VFEITGSYHGDSVFVILLNSYTLGHSAGLAFLGRAMFVDIVTEMLPFLALDALGAAILLAALAALWSSRRTERLG